MPFKRPTLAQLDNRIRSDIAGHVRMADSNRAAALLRRSVVGVKSRVYAGACNDLYAYQAWLADQRFVHKMEDEFLDAEGAMYDMRRKAAKKAKGFAVIRGADGAQILVNRVFRHDSGQNYTLLATAVIKDGITRLWLEAADAGANGNLRPGSVLRPLQPIADIHDDAVVDEDGITGGVEQESDEDYRERILRRKRQPPHGGADFDYVAWALEVPGVTRAWCLPLWMGLGTVGVMVMRDNDPDPFPDEHLCQEVWEHINEQRPVTAEHFVFAPIRHPVDFTVKLWPDDDAVRQAVTDELDDFIFRDGDPDTSLNNSRMSESISAAIGEHHHELIMPAGDIRIPKNAVPVLGQVIFVDNLRD